MLKLNDPQAEAATLLSLMDELATLKEITKPFEEKTQQTLQTYRTDPTDENFEKHAIATTLLQDMHRQIRDMAMACAKVEHSSINTHGWTLDMLESRGEEFLLKVDSVCTGNRAIASEIRSAFAKMFGTREAVHGISMTPQEMAEMMDLRTMAISNN